MRVLPPAPALAASERARAATLGIAIALMGAAPCGLRGVLLAAACFGSSVAIV